MPYVTSIERLGREEGRAEGRVEGRVEGRIEGKYQHALDTVQRFAKFKFGELGDSIYAALLALEIEELDTLLGALFEMESKQELIDWLKHTKQE